jgi:carboxyl-terminal processing protease
VPLNYHAQMKITVAKYYIPSGRCVQAIDYSHRDQAGVAHKLPDSLRTAYKTHNGRTVYDGDGIEPDIEIKPTELSNIAISLLQNFHVFDFANLYAYTHKTIFPAKQFTVTDSIYNAFCAYLKDKDYNYQTETEKQIAAIRKEAKDEGYYTDIQSELDELDAKLAERKKQDLQIHRNEIETLLGPEIVSRYYYDKGATEYILPQDTEVQEAIKTLDNQNKIEQILK